jgi:DinB superfamily
VTSPFAQDPGPAQPDDKDWTWVLSQPCPDCGYDASTLTGRDVPGIARDVARRFEGALTRPDAAHRPSPEVWSVLEYGCHVRDACRVFGDRVQMMLAEDEPTFPNWDQDASAIDERYWEQDARVVSAQLAEGAERAAEEFELVRDDQWKRTGERSNGSRFTVDSLARYFAHDLVHHARDIGA